jgi:hypothetical protein
MKTSLVIVLSLLMALTQSVFTAQPAPGKPAKCACICSMPCCIREAAPVPQPVTPAPPVSQNFHQQLLLLAVLAQIQWILPTALPANFNASPASLLPATAVPLYQRNCSYLI